MAVGPSRENHSRAAIRNLHENYFAVVGPQFRKTLPVALNTIQTENTLKYGLIDFLTKLPVEPPARNYMQEHTRILYMMC